MKKWFLLLSYGLMVVAANVLTSSFGLVPIGLGLVVTAGTFAAGAVLILRDYVQLNFGRITVLAAVGIGALISAITATPEIAIASGVAFFGSELTDYFVFSRIVDRGVGRAIILSSLISAPLDTVLFLELAGFPVTLEAIAGQVIVKTILALLVAGGRCVVSLRV